MYSFWKLNIVSTETPLNQNPILSSLESTCMIVPKWVKITNWDWIIPGSSLAPGSFIPSGSIHSGLFKTAQPSSKTELKCLKSSRSTCRWLFKSPETSYYLFVHSAFFFLFPVKCEIVILNSRRRPVTEFCCLTALPIIYQWSLLLHG